MRTETALAQEAPRLALFAPVAFGTGVALYFAWPTEPPALAGAASWVALGLAGLALTSAAILLAARARAGGPSRAALRLGLLAIGLLLLGHARAEQSALALAAPVLAERMVAALEGRLIRVDGAASGAPRLLLDRVTIAGLTAQATPARVRLTAPDADLDAVRPLVGRRVRIAEARLGPPPPPVEPGGFDGRRRAFLERIGAVGLARAPAVDLGPSPTLGPLDRAWERVTAARGFVASRARTAWPGAVGDTMAALLVGDRSGLDAETLEALRISNLSHLLSISGVHLGLVALTVFGAVRLTLALGPRAPLGIAPKKTAAAVAILAAAGYLALGGAELATQRAFVMTAVAFGAVLVDRPAVTLRGVALAAAIVLALAPEGVVDIGFRLSFAATVAMVAAFEAARPWLRAQRRVADAGGAARRLARAAVVVVLVGALASFVAGLATAPFAALTFGRLAPYGLPANALAGPLMGALIMPAGVAALMLTPLGLEQPAMLAMGAGVAQVLGVAAWVASWPGADLAAASPGVAEELVAGLLAAGGLALCLWRGLGPKALGLGPIALAFGLWSLGPARPEVLIAPGGRLVGVLTPAGRALDRPRVETFAAAEWLRADGDPASPEAAAARSAFARFAGGKVARVGRWRVELALGERIGAAALDRACRGPTLLIAPRAVLPAARPPDCLAFDRPALAAAGAIALRLPAEGPPVVTTAAEVAGDRLWTRTAEQVIALQPSE